MPFADLLGMVERDEPAEDRLLPDRQTDAVPELERERGLFVRESELLRSRPHADHLAGGGAGTDQLDRRVEVVAAALVRVDERPRRAGDRERAVVARAVAHEAVEDVEVRRVARAQRAVGVDVRVGVAALAGDRVDALDELGAHVVEDLVDEPDALVLAHPGTHRAVQLLVGGVDHRARLVQQRDLVAGLDHSRLLHQLLAVDDLDPSRPGAQTARPARPRRRRPARPAGRAARARRGSCSPTSSARPDSGDIAPRRVEMPARERPSASHGL